MTAPCDQQKPVAEKYAHVCMYSPFIKITYILTFPIASLEQLLRTISCAASWTMISFCPK